MSLTTSIRERGTAVHAATTIQAFVEACQHICDHGYAKVNGCTVDAFTASMVVQVWSKLNEKNRGITSAFWDKRYAIRPDIAAKATVDIFWKCIRK